MGMSLQITDLLKSQGYFDVEFEAIWKPNKL